MKKFSSHLFNELSDFSSNVPNNFRAFYAKSDGFWGKDTLGESNRFLVDKDLFSAAFVTWNKINDNFPDIHLYVLNAVEHSDLYNVFNTLSIFDSYKKVIILQPGSYSIHKKLDFYGYNILGIKGFSKEDTIINIYLDEAIAGVNFIENINFNYLPKEFNSGVKVISGNNIKSCCFDNKISNMDFIAFSDFLNVDNVVVFNTLCAFNNCSNISNAIVNLTITSSSFSSLFYLFYSCSNINNVNLYLNSSVSCFYNCVNINNVVAENYISNDSYFMVSCKNIINIKANNFSDYFISCEYISNVLIAQGNRGFFSCNMIASCFVYNLSSFAFRDCFKVTLCKAEDCFDGFIDCSGMSNNQALNNSNTNYNNCFSDNSNNYSVSDTGDGGFNS